MRYRLRAAVAFVAVLALVGAACGGGGKKSPTPAATGSLAGTSITLSVSLAESEVGPVEEVLKMFKDQTGVNVKLTSVTAQDLPQKLQVEVSSGQHTIQLFAQDNLALATLVLHVNVPRLGLADVEDILTKANSLPAEERERVLIQNARK